MNFYNQRQESQPNDIDNTSTKNNNIHTDYFKNVSPEMLNFGINAGQDMLNKQRDKWMPGLSGFWHSLKYYFAVNNNYVSRKLLIILYPISNKIWNRLQADEYVDTQSEVSNCNLNNLSTTNINNEGEIYSRKWAVPRIDINAPDLYIPLMSFMTYVLLYGLGKGLGSTNFSPDVIIQAIWRCLILQLLETAGIKFGVNLMSSNIPFLDIFSYTGYKYVALCVNLIARILGGTISFIVSIFTSCMLSYLVLKTMAAVIPPATTTGPPRHLLLLAFALIQFVIIVTLSML